MGAVAALVVRGPDDLADQLGHVHLNVELGHVGKGLEVEVTVFCKILSGRQQTIYIVEEKSYQKRIGGDL